MENLVSRFKNGDTVALEYLINEYSSALMRFIKSYVPDTDCAKDIVQDAFISLWNKRVELSDNSNFKSLLYTICKNRALNMIRNEKKFLNNIDVSALWEANIKSLSYIPTDLMEDAEMEERINHLISSLPEKYKEVFLKSRVEEKTYSQISVELNISQKAVEKRMNKTFSFFRDRLNEGFLLLFFFLR